MGIYSFLSNLVSKKNAADAVYPGTWIPMSGETSDSVSERTLLLKNKEWVYIAVDRVAAAVASAPFRVKRYKRNGDDEEIFDGPLVSFLEKPGPGFTGKDFIYLNTVYKELTGNAFWEKLGTKVSLYPLVPTRVTPIITGGKLTGFKYTEGGSDRQIKYDNVLHDRYVDPNRPYWGAGKLQKIARWVDTSSFANEFLRRFFLNGATFGGFIETEEESQERIQLIKAGLANDHVGVENAHKVGVLPKGAKYQATTASMSQIEMGATDDRYRDKILSGFGVPKTLVGLTTEVNRASAEASEYIFARYTVKPIVDDFLEFLNVQIAPLLDPSGTMYFDVDEFVPVNMEIELKERQIALAGQSYKTVNEVRSDVGLPPVDGGDVIYGPPFQSPLGTPSAAPGLPPGDDEDPEDEETPAPPAKGRPRAISGRVRDAAKREEALDRIATKLAEITTKVEDPDEVAWRSFVGRVESYTDQLDERVRQFNQRQRQSVIQRLNNITGVQPNEKAVAKKDIFDLAGEIAVMIDIAGPLLRGLMTEQAMAEYEAQGFEGTFDVGADMIGKTVNLAAKRLGKSYNKTTLALLKRTLNEGLTNGDGLDQLTKRVNEVYDYSDTVRARMVAHTESFYIANKGSKEAYRQSGVVQSLRWYTAEDERVCPFCEPENGKIIGVNDTFYKKGDVLVGSNGATMHLDYRSIDVPPIHANCRCFVRPEDISIE